MHSSVDTYMKSKKFKKRYVKNAPEMGVTSGRATGVPVGGAIGGGDGENAIVDGKRVDCELGHVALQGQDVSPPIAWSDNLSLAGYASDKESLRWPP